MDVSPTSSSSPQRLATATAPQRATATPFTNVLKAITERLTDVVSQGENLVFSVAGLSQPSAPLLEETTASGNGLLAGQLDLDAALEAFQDAVHEGLREQGVDTLEAIALQLDAQGRLIVAEDHPDRAAIEQFFRDHPEFVEQFEQLADRAPRPADEKRFQIRLTLFGPEVEFV